MSVAGETLLSVEDLRIAFGGVEAVRGISFSIARGETLGLVGESGSGKSATSLAMLRLLPEWAVVSGSMWFAGAEDGPGLKPIFEGGRYRGLKPGAPPEKRAAVPGMRDAAPGMRAAAPEQLTAATEQPAARLVNLLELSEGRMRGVRGREIAMIFQEPMTALNPVMTVGRQIAEAVLAHAPKTGRREVRERVVEAMREVALPEPERRMGDYPHQFSGGQRQRVLIAMALVNKPRLLIADEPTTALDVTVQAQILELLRGLKEKHGLAMLFISHDLAVVAQVADKVAVMRRGEIVEAAGAAEIFARPQHEYTRTLLAAAPTMRSDRNKALATVGIGG